MLRFINDYRLENDFLRERDANFIFNLSTITRIKENEVTDHLYLSFPEFIEIIARIAEIMSLPPPLKFC